MAGASIGVCHNSLFLILLLKNFVHKLVIHGRTLFTYFNVKWKTNIVTSDLFVS